MAITNWSLNERPREKLLRIGVSELSKAELLAIFLRTGVKGKTALDLARELLQRHQGLRGLLNLPQSQMTAIKGLGNAKYATLQAALELGRRYLEEELILNPSLTSTLATKQYLIAKLASYKQEVFACIFLDTAHRIIQYQELFYGTISSAPIYPRIVAQKALEYNAAAVIFAHNHPSGSSTPSESDIVSTNELVKVLNHLDIRVLDHLIVGGNSCSSLAEQGLL